MEQDWYVLEAMTLCRYKAWQLSKEDGRPPVHLEDENVIILAKPSVSAKDKVAAVAYFQSRGYMGKGIVILHGPEGKSLAKVGLGPYRKKAAQLLAETAETVASKAPPAFYRNPHCPECKFHDACMEKLKERECISLLGGITGKALDRYHRRGIFSITQLSHTFRPRRRGRKPQTAGASFLWDLKALAIREQKVFVMYPPELEASAVNIYMDFEGIPDEKSEYLFGVIIRQEGHGDESHSLWAETKAEEKEIFGRLLDLLERFPDAPIYHFGSYENKTLRYATKRWDGVFAGRIQSVAKRMVNLLGYLRTHVYPPIYGNGLKELGNFLGMSWTDSDASGAQSIVWRKAWESESADEFKEKLLRYNMDDCTALIAVHEWLDRLADNADPDKVSRVAAMKRESPFHFHDNPEFNEDFQRINKAAYFDYQRSKIYLRGEKGVSISKSAVAVVAGPGKGYPAWQPKTVNEYVTFPQGMICTRCGCTKVYRVGKTKRIRQTDLRFTPKGIRQWVTEYSSGQSQCAKCKYRMSDGNLRVLQYGDNLFAWAVNMYVSYNVSYRHLASMLQEQFGISVIPTYLMLHKRKWLKKWEPELALIKEAILKSPVIHIDETSIRLRNTKGHVWTLATPHAVYYTYTPTREAGWLEAVLGEYEGVVVTDFFTGFDALPVKRQKCLIHLIRDMNDDLFRNPFDTEFALMVKAFGELLRKIVGGVDRYGLLADKLGPCLNDVGDYYITFIEPASTSPLVLKYTKRLYKHWDEMWTFLECDGVPWNNNYAENAIKPFARFRHRTDGLINETGITEYLHLLSMAQTCKYRGLSFLEFLLCENSDEPARSGNPH